MSEQAKLTLLQEKIKDAKNHERSGNIFGSVGIILTAIGFTVYAYGLRDWSFLALGILGLFAVIPGIAENVYYGRMRMRLMRELEKEECCIEGCKEYPDTVFFIRSTVKEVKAYLNLPEEVKFT